MLLIGQTQISILHVALYFKDILHRIYGLVLCQRPTPNRHPMCLIFFAKFKNELISKYQSHFEVYSDHFHVTRRMAILYSHVNITTIWPNSKIQRYIQIGYSLESGQCGGPRIKNVHTMCCDSFHEHPKCHVNFVLLTIKELLH